MSRFAYHPSRRPPIPSCPLTIFDRTRTRSVSTDPAYLDTAADVTVVPLDLIRQLVVAPVGQAGARGLGKARGLLDVYEVVIAIPNVSPVLALVIGHPDEPTVLLGRTILNLFRITFDGPNQTAEFH